MSLDFFLDWLHLFLRWFHVIAAFTWLGQTHLFNRLEKWMSEEPPKEGGNVSGSLWMVHGGGFYYLQKQMKPALMPRTLRWFKWQSMLTWISGFFLLMLLFYYEGALTDGTTSFAMAAGIGLAVIFLSWPLYTLLWRSPIGKNEPVGVAICFAAVVGLAFGLSHVLGHRAMFLHIGGMFGTIMTANVWLTIIPSQKELVDSVESGREPDMRLAARAKQASKHNTYMSFPVIIFMLISHFPNITFDSPYNWEILGGLIVVGWIAAKIIRG